MAKSIRISVSYQCKMLGLSWGEIFVIGILGLVILGPDELPRIAKTIMQVLNSFRRQSDEVRREFYNAVYKPADEIRREISQSLTVESQPTLKQEVKDTQPEHQNCEQTTGESCDDNKQQ